MLFGKSALDEGKYTVSHRHSGSKGHLSVWNSNDLWSRCSNIHVKCPAWRALPVTLGQQLKVI